MYSLKKAYARNTVEGNRWMEVDTDTLLAEQIFQINGSYRDLNMILTHATEPDVDLLFNYSLDAAKFFNRTGQNITLLEWFTALGNLALPTEVARELRTLYACVANPFDAGFSVDKTIPSAQPNPDTPMAARRDLILTHPTLTPKTVYENCLGSINGFLHRSYHSDWGFYLQEGGRTATRSNNNAISLLSFANLGGIEIIPISEDMVTGLPEEGQLSGPLYLNTGDYDWTGKSAMLVLGGYLVTPGKTFRPTGAGNFRLNILQYPVMDHFMEADEYLDMEAVRATMDRLEGSPSVTAVEQFFSKKTLLAYLTMSQSFIVAINSPGVFTNRYPVETTQAPGVYICAKQPTSLLVGETGRILDYVTFRELDKFTLHAGYGLVNKWMYRTTNWRRNQVLDNKKETLSPYRLMDAKLLEIGCDYLV